MTGVAAVGGPWLTLRLPGALAKSRRSLRFRGDEQPGELAGGGLQDAHVDHLARRDSVRRHDDRPLPLADPPVWPIQLVASFDEHLDVATDPALGLARANPALESEEVIQAPELLVVRHVVFHPGGG